MNHPVPIMGLILVVAGIGAGIAAGALFNPALAFFSFAAVSFGWVTVMTFWSAND